MFNHPPTIPHTVAKGLTIPFLSWVVTVCSIWPGNVLQLHFVVHFINHLEISVPNNIAEEPLLDETRVRCII